MNEKRLTGFALLTPEARRRMASIGGAASSAAVPADQRGFALDPERARECGRRGGQAVPAERRAYAVDKKLASAAGRKGGLAPRADQPIGAVSAAISAISDPSAEKSQPGDER